MYPKDEVERMRALAQTIEWALNEDAKPGDSRLGFALFVFPFGADPNAKMNYISSAERGDMIAALIGFIDDYFTNKLGAEIKAQERAEAAAEAVAEEKADGEASGKIIPFSSHKGPRKLH